MRRFLPWIILGGVALFVIVIMAQILGTYFYLKSPERAVAGAFAKLLHAKSFRIDLEAAQQAPHGFSLRTEGGIDKRVITRPVADMVFSFQAPDQSFYGKGDLKAVDGKLYLRFSEIAGIDGLLPGSLQAIWAGMDMQTLVAIAKEGLFPESEGSLTEDDLKTIAQMAAEGMPIAVYGKGEMTWVGTDQAMRYPVRVDKTKLSALISEINAAVKGAPLSGDENRHIARAVASYPEISGEVWIGRSDGRLLAMTAIVGQDERALHVSAKISRYDQPVAAEAPLDPQPLITLFRRAFGSTLGGMKMKLPFDLPVPIWEIEQNIPQVDLPPGEKGGEGGLGGLPDLVKLFYGTDKPFGEGIR
jgi:hypothetical protein